MITKNMVLIFALLFSVFASAGEVSKEDMERDEVKRIFIDEESSDLVLTTMFEVCDEKGVCKKLTVEEFIEQDRQEMLKIHKKRSN